MVTARTVGQGHLFQGEERLGLLRDTLFQVADAYGWHLLAWAVFSNHYHLVAVSPAEGPDIRKLVSRLHSQTARQANRLDGAPGRQVWFQYRDTCLTYENSFLARLHYVMNNPVHHGLTPHADLYPYCSAAWFAAEADSAFRGKVESFRYDRLNLEDEF